MFIDPRAGSNRPKLLAGCAAISMLEAGMVVAAAPSIEEMETQMQGFIDASTQLVAAADQAGRDLTDDELQQIEDNYDQRDRLVRQINARRQAIPPTPAAGTHRRTSPEPRTPQPTGGTGAAPRVPIPAQARGGRNDGGFLSFGEFAMAVRAHAVTGQLDSRIAAAATTSGGESSGADGGFAVPPDFRATIWQKVMEEENLITRCAGLTTGANSITIPKDETTPWQTSGGVQVYWEAEAAQVTQSKPQLTFSQIRLAKLMALVPISDELLEDAPGLESWLRAKAPAKMAAKINTAIISGTGVGQPLGFLSSPATISVAKETSQPADTIYFANVQKMWARMYAPCRRNAIWIINQDTEPQLNGMAFAPASTVPIPVYLPANGLSESPYATLMGRPVVPLEAASTLGTQGDINLVDLTQYWVVTKAGQDIRVDVSMHLFFDQALQAFRFIFRVNGQPAWGANIQPQHGNNTRSCFVTLDTRA